MFKNYLKTAFRNLKRNKVFSFINIVGLSAGMACCLVISLYVHDELIYDTYVPDYDRVYRVALERKYPDHKRNYASSSVMLAPTLMENFPGVEKAGRVHRLFFSPEIPVTVQGETYQEDRFLVADSAFLDLMEFEFIEGNAVDALSDAGKVILTESTALRYFGTTNVLDSTILAGTGDVTISGVIKDLPSQSHIEIDLLGSIDVLPYLVNAEETTNWTSPWLYTYIKLHPDTDPVLFENQISDIVETYGAANIEREVGVSMEEYAASGHKYTYFLQPLTDIHLHSNLDVELVANGNIIYVNLMIAIVVFILIISCINFINLSTARSTERAKEVGVRKVMGSGKKGLIGQFLLEAVVFSMISMLLAMVWTYTVLPYFNAVIGKELTVDILMQWEALSILSLLGLFVGVLAGIYPSLVISSIQPSTVLKGDYKASSRGIWLRNSLVVFQFFISILLVTGTLVVDQQLDFIRSKNLGFEKENLITIKQAGNLGENWAAFRNELNMLPGVIASGGTQVAPGGFFGSNLFTPDDPEKPVMRANIFAVDDDYFKAMGMGLVDGRSFEPEFDDSLGIIINEAAAEVLNYSDPIGRELSNVMPGAEQQPPPRKIVGVVKDFNFQSLHAKVYPLVISNGGDQFTPNVVVVRITGENTTQTIASIEQAWDKVVPNQQLSYSFLDQDLDALYVSEQRSRKIFNAFTSIAILMACIGLFGLTTYITQQRAKEIGIRKVLGASAFQLVLLLSKNLTYLVAIALLVAVPVSMLGITRWLDVFAYHVDVKVTLFIYAGLVTFVIAWITISYQAIRLALLNPIRSIRED